MALRPLRLLSVSTRRFDLPIFLMCSAGALAALGWLMRAGLVDDTYIFLRYADNIARGVGPVFNDGERVEGFSSPAWTLMLAGVRLFTPQLELAALLLSAASALGVSTLVRYGLCQPHLSQSHLNGLDGSMNTLLLAFGLLSLPATVYWGFSGMEHPFFTLVVTAALVSVLADDRRRGVSAGTTALLILALVTRPEGVLLVTWIALFFTIRHGRLDAHWLRCVAAPIGVVVAALGILLAARYAYFGSIVPNTYYAKMIPNTWERFEGGASYLGRCLVVHAPLLLVAAMLYGVASKHGVAPKLPAAFLAGWVVFWSIYIGYVGGDHFAMFRFFLPALPACVLLIGLLWQSVQRHVAPAWGPRFRAVLATAFLLSSLCGTLSDGPRARREPPLAKMWRNAGKWIADNTPTNTLLATNVIGAIGYFSKRRIVDMAGLVDPVVAREGAIYTAAQPGHARYDTDYIFRRAPDLVVYYTSGGIGEPPFTAVWQLLPVWHFSLIDFLRDPRCAERYEHVAVPLSDGSFLEMQKKRTFPLPPGYLTAAGL